MLEHMEKQNRIFSGFDADAIDRTTAADLAEVGSDKWTRYPGCIGAFIAEMDYGLAPCIQQAIDSACDHCKLGYIPEPWKRRVAEACAGWQKSHYGWDVDPDIIRVVPDVLEAYEIFLRELISNASDAVDKLNFKSLQDPSVKINQGDLAIRVSFDKDARTITISDNGIGMTAEELERNLGTIAHSGSEEFKTENAEQQGSDVDIIGQFGVGFYSAFMVASHVKVVSRAYGEDVAHVWESDGLEGYTIEDGERAEHGTDVILTLRENEKLDADGEAETYDRFLTEWGLKSLIQQYSNYVRYPIQMMVSKSRQKPKPEDAGDDYKHEYEDYQELETVNSMTPIWKKRSSDVEQKDYDEFYKSTFHDFDDPARTISFHAEGTLEYDALLFVPGRAPFDLYSKDYEKGLALYSSNVLIMEKCDDLLPDYYNFVRGVVDSADVSLNISRETLQQNRQLKAIAKRVEKKITADLEDMRDNDREAYEKFFENFGRGLKYGIYSSYGTVSYTHLTLPTT